MNLPRSRPVLVGLASLVVLAAGVVVHRTAPPLSFGWFAYSPLPDEIPVPTNPARTRRHFAGVFLAAVGLAGASATLGYRWARRPS